MKTALLVLAVLAAAPAFADDSGPYVLRDGRRAAPAAAPAATPIRSHSRAPSAALGATNIHPSSFSGHVGGRALGGSRLGTLRAAQGRTALGNDNTPQPEYSKPGALIRSEGQLPVYTDPGNATTHAVEGGGFVAQDPRYARSLGGQGISYGPADKMPGTNPSTGGAGGNGVTSNGGSSSGGSSSGSSGSGGNSGADNNGQHNGQDGGSASPTGFEPVSN